MELGIVGIGGMGFDMATRLIGRGGSVVGTAKSTDAVQKRG